MYLRVRSDGTVNITCPPSTSDAEILRFVQGHAGWISGRMQKIRHKIEAENHSFEEGETVRIWGRDLPIEIRHEKPYGAIIHGETLVINEPHNSSPQERQALFESFRRASLAAAIPEHMVRWQPVLGVNAKSLAIRDMKSRWGSCNCRTGRLCFNLRLVEKDPKCLEYVVVHELCHLIVPNHSPAFWAEVAKCIPDWKARRKLTNSTK